MGVLIQSMSFNVHASVRACVRECLSACESLMRYKQMISNLSLLIGVKSNPHKHNKPNSNEMVFLCRTKSPCVVLRPKHACELKSCEIKTRTSCCLDNSSAFYHFDLTFFPSLLLHCYIKCHHPFRVRNENIHKHTRTGFNAILSEARRQCKQSTRKK